MKINELLTESTLEEGVNDPAIFKAVFVVGGPGSGKTYITKQLGLSGMGYVPINSDIAFEYLMKKRNLDPKMPSSEEPERELARDRAKEITSNKSALALQGRLGVVIDGTGDKFDKINKLKENFELLGYETFLVVVNTRLSIARQRNQQRDRTVPDEIVVDSWRAVQQNIGAFASVFKNYAVIDNNGEPSTQEQINQTYNRLIKFTNKPPRQPAATQWIAAQSKK